MVLTQLILFNRRRQGEVSKIRLSDFVNNCKKGEESVTDIPLTEWEKALSKVLWRVEIVGKRGRTVPLLISEDMKNNIDLLIKNRGEVVNEDNVFLFPVVGSLNHIRGCDALRKYAEACGCKKPELIRSTRLRKHIATVSQIMNLKDNELDVLANFLGHDVRVHREYYRLPNATVQVAKVSKLLMALENGSITSIQGKSLDEVTLNPLEEVDAECESDDDDHNEKQNDVVDQPPPLTSNSKQTRIPWTEKEAAAVMRHLGNHILTNIIPSKKDIDICLRKEGDTLYRRSWRNIKDFCRNKIVKKSRQLHKFVN
ncbi:uncharacterized protein LOC117100634 isoform X1 [Anneissia japonica]|uniref:uncharacterized protein LOC117100634 isoform X1 n=1 Tax=Anneissia japonica TaxID=1529436 RepID=UPI001425901F|nr:uncharacterized protein LOC117100634 isoform X1 [Anneissia japonica]